MKKHLKKILPMMLALAMLGGCGSINSEQDNLSEDYTIVNPDGEVISTEEKIPEDNFSTYVEDNVENYVDESNVSNIESFFEDILPESDSSENDEETSETTVSSPAETITYKVYSHNTDVSKKARNVVDGMSDREKAAQLILARCPSENAAGLMADYQFAGYTLYAADLAERDMTSAAEFIAEIKASVEITPIITVDEEGGNVVRVSKYPAYRAYPFKSPQIVYNEEGMDGIISDSAEKAQLLTSLGFNMNLAPVADIASPGDYIYDRTAGQDSETTGDIVRQIVDTSGDNGLISCLKHFPGYGSNIDTHTGIAYDSRSMESFEATDFIPFEIGLSGSYVPSVLVSHNIVECMDSELPASLSPSVHKLLRDRFDFEGVIITDDLGMDAIKAYTGSLSPYVVGILSGNDLLCVSDPVTAYNDLVSAIEDGTISQKVLDEHVLRVVQMKLDYDII
ncbi:MAG: beta-hexosaminidase [Oscillospiraceae bacterium]|nr:beta-hexosaminidase [Oscillospiraceae bacterium]